MSHKNENFLTLDYILLLRAIKIYHHNMTFLTMSKTKIWRCTKNNFVSKQSLMLLKKLSSVDKNKLMLHKKSISCPQKQDGPA